MSGENKSLKIWLAVGVLNFIPLLAYGDLASDIRALTFDINSTSGRSIETPTNLYANIDSLLYQAKKYCKPNCSTGEFATMEPALTAIEEKMTRLIGKSSFEGHKELLTKIGALWAGKWPGNGSELRTKLEAAKNLVTGDLTKIETAVKDKNIRPSEFYNQLSSLMDWSDKFCDTDEGLCSSKHQNNFGLDTVLSEVKLRVKRLQGDLFNTVEDRAELVKVQAILDKIDHTNIKEQLDEVRKVSAERELAQIFDKTPSPTAAQIINILHDASAWKNRYPKHAALADPKIHALMGKSSGTGSGATGSATDPDKLPLIGDLKIEELDNYFTGFVPGLKGEEPNMLAHVSGLILDACKTKFKIEPRYKPEGATCAKSVGFSVTDIGGGRQCVAKQKKLGNSCGNGTAVCTRLSITTDPNLNTLLKLKDQGDVSVKLVYEDETSDHGRLKCADFSPPLEYKTPGTVAKEEEDKEVEKRKQEVKTLETQARCRTSEDDLDIALQAIARLRDLKEISDKTFAQKEKEIEATRFKLIVNRAKSTSIDALPELREEIIGWASAHPKDAGRSIQLLQLIAQRYTNQKDATTEAWDRAEETIAEAEGLAESMEGSEKLILSTEKSLARARIELKIGRVATSAQEDGLANNNTFESEFGELLKDTMAQTSEACMSRRSSQEDCSFAMRNQKLVISLPARAHEVDNRKREQQMQFQQMMQQSGVHGQGMGQGQAPYNMNSMFHPDGNYGAGNFNQGGMFGGNNMGGNYNPSMSGGMFSGGNNMGHGMNGGFNPGMSGGMFGGGNNMAGGAFNMSPGSNWYSPYNHY